MKIYVAAKFSDKERVKSIYEQLKQAGHTITHEWIHNKSSYPFADDPAFTQRCAREDIEGIQKADAFILLSNKEPSVGATGELGAAIALYLAIKKPHIYVVGPHFDTNFWFFHPAVIQKESIEDVLCEMSNMKLLGAGKFLKL